MSWLVFFVAPVIIVLLGPEIGQWGMIAAFVGLSFVPFFLDM
tara:strand:+ start:50 stop:175 length:126 start_codon:yes stop_codon:yes gene_type:complete